MTTHTRRSLLGGIVGAAALFAGCSETTSSASGSFTETTVENQQLIVEFDESLDAETISVIDPDGESFAETSVAAGTSHVSFDIGMPYAPGEYRIIAAGSEDTLAETTQESQPELEIVDVGVGANRLDEMPEELGHAREAEAIVSVRNVGTGPELISGLRFEGDLPTPRNLAEDRIGIYKSELPGEARKPVKLENNEESDLYSSTLPFIFEGNGVDCRSESQTGKITVELRGEILGTLSKEFRIDYTASESYDGCEISLQEGE